MGWFSKKNSVQTVDAHSVQDRLYSEFKNSSESLNKESESKEESVQKEIDPKPSYSNVSSQKVNDLEKELAYYKSYLKERGAYPSQGYRFFVIREQMMRFFFHRRIVIIFLVINIFFLWRLSRYQSQYQKTLAPYGYSTAIPALTLPLTIQFGEYVSLQEAFEKEAYLKKETGFESDIYFVQDEYYTLCVGYYASLEAAQVVLKQLHRFEDYRSSIITKRY